MCDSYPGLSDRYRFPFSQVAQKAIIPTYSGLEENKAQAPTDRSRFPDGKSL
ncbi:hypothetical protein NDI44_27630 [Trichocoleus sp. DQ-A3]|uniref:hypothetical protein n=1 Tax=Cyanophyceae TaxID=3028117 RepID=UPI0016856248|nr:hypothetical protein [Coleofasciculus sp. FACHB-125]MBD1903668.1 hypothetical protein [Coleofasciculus sp. FACHB-125]